MYPERIKNKPMTVIPYANKECSIESMAMRNWKGFFITESDNIAVIVQSILRIIDINFWFYQNMYQECSVVSTEKGSSSFGIPSYFKSLESLNIGIVVRFGKGVCSWHSDRTHFVFWSDPQYSITVYSTLAVDQGNGIGRLLVGELQIPLWGRRNRCWIVHWARFRDFGGCRDFIVRQYGRDCFYP